MAEKEIKRRRATRFERQQRLKQIHKLMILGLTVQEMAERIGCNERTVRRDLDADYERLERDGHREVAANRAAIMAELAGPDGAFLEGPGAMAASLVLMNRAMSIAGGTSEIKRNQIGERILGLPPEHRVDKDIAYKDLDK